MEYLDALRRDDDESENQRLRWGCSAFGWILFGAILVFTAVFAVKFFNYYQKMKQDGYVSLPQSMSSLSARDDVAFGNSQAVVPDSELLTEDSASFGVSSADAKLTVVMFGDFGCPFCQQVSLPLRTAMEKHKDEVRFVYRHYPSDKLHPNATQAAQAAECAGEQGRFWAMFDKLSLNSTALGFEDLTRYGTEIGLDSVQFGMCLTSERYLGRVNRDVNAAHAIGVVGTPTFFFNGQMAAGAMPSETLEGIIQMFLSPEK